MQKIAIWSALTLVAAAVQAQDMGRVLSSVPVVQQVQVPRQVCANQQIEVQPPKSGAGAAVGAIAGGALGNASASGRSRGAATVAGAVLGAVVGGALESSPEPRAEMVTSCSTQMAFENRTIGYDVTYEFGGRTYTTRMPNDPGPSIAVQVAPVGAPAPAVVSPAPVVVQSAPVVTSSYVTSTYVTPTVVPVYYPRPVYAPLTFSWGVPYWGGGGRWEGHHHRH